MIDIYYNEDELEKTKIDVDGDDLFGLMGSVASVIDGIINVVTVRHVAPEGRVEASKAIKALLLDILTSREGTEIESFQESLGISQGNNEIDEK